MNIWCILIGSGFIILDSILMYYATPSGIFFGLGIAFIVIGVYQPFETELRSLEKPKNLILKDGSEKT